LTKLDSVFPIFKSKFSYNHNGEFSRKCTQNVLISDVSSASGLPDVPVPDANGTDGCFGTVSQAASAAGATRQKGQLPTRAAQGQTAADGGAQERERKAQGAGRQHRLLPPPQRRPRRLRRRQVLAFFQFSAHNSQNNNMKPHINSFPFYFIQNKSYLREKKL